MHGLGFSGGHPVLSPAHRPLYPAKPPALPGGKLLRFSGEAVAGAGKNGLWVTVELSPYAIVGGLGQVSETIPEALNKTLGKDVRVLAPLLAPMKKHPDFQPTGLSLELPGPDGQPETFTLYRRSLPGKPVVYAIGNDQYFGNHANLYFKKDQPVAGLGKDAIFTALMMFNRAAAKFLPLLDPQFDGPVDFVMVHDWLSSPFLSELPPETRQKLGKIFMLHNTFNEARDLNTALSENRMQPPPFSAKNYSPLAIGLNLADTVIANRNYASRIADTLSPKSDYGVALQEKIKAGQVFDMHHGLSDRYDPYENPALKQPGFTELPKTTPPRGIRRLLSRPFPALDPQHAAMRQFKRVNKAGLQTALGLTPNPQATLFSWVARPDPYQKGFNLLMGQAHDFLLKNPSVQMVIAGPTLSSTPDTVAHWVETLMTDPRLQGRVSFPGFTSFERVAQIYAGSDFLILPSLYEPYGLSQLEAMKLGCIPIVHGVDGLRSTVSDPDRNHQVKGPSEAVWTYGQTGLLMNPLDVHAYWKALKTTPPTPEATKVLSQAEAALRGALDRGLSLARKPDQATRVRLNGLSFVEAHHRWETIAPRYRVPLETAIKTALNAAGKAVSQ